MSKSFLKMQILAASVAVWSLFSSDIYDEIEASPFSLQVKTYMYLLCGASLKSKTHKLFHVDGQKGGEKCKKKVTECLPTKEKKYTLQRFPRGGSLT